MEADLYTVLDGGIFGLFWHFFQLPQLQKETQNNLRHIILNGHILSQGCLGLLNMEFLTKPEKT